MRVQHLALAGFAVLGLTSMASSQVFINEIRIDQTGTDNQEYFELSGSAGASLNDLTYIVIGDGTGASGVIEAVISLAGLAVPGDGFFLAVESTWTTAPPSGWPGGAPDLTAGTLLNFENSDNVTHMLVSGFTGANGNDLDTNDDGTLDSTPWTSLLDSVAVVIDPTATTSEKFYSPNVVGPDGLFAPGHVYRVGNAPGPWAIGDFDGAPAFQDTPGISNVLVPEPATLGALAIASAALLRRRKR